MEQDFYSKLTDAEARQLDVSMNMALIHRNGFVKYLKTAKVLPPSARATPFLPVEQVSPKYLHHP